MMESILAAAWLGLLTAVSPCPMATNVAAISYVGRRLSSPWLVFLSGLLYTLGRCFAYVSLGTLILSSLLNIPLLSDWLQRYTNMLLGPILIIAGMFLLEWLSFNFGQGVDGQKMEALLNRTGLAGSLLMGILFALSFCPVSAALFFGSLVPLALNENSRILLPLVYGLMTGIPVLIFALLIAFGAGKLGGFFNLLTKFEKIARTLTGTIFILVGVYYVLIYIYGVSI